MNSFMDHLTETLKTDSNLSITENGAIGYRTTGKKLLDMNFAVSSLCAKTEAQIIEQFTRVFYEDRRLALKWLFFARDIREGMGERRLFRICFYYLAKHHEATANALLPLIPEYGRYDDLLCLLDTPVKDAVVTLIKEQLTLD